MHATLKIANIGLNSQADIDSNLVIIKQAVNDASEQGAKLIVLPENACLMGHQSPLAARFDEMVDFYATLACKNNVHILAGTLPCAWRPDGTKVADGKYRQSSLLFDNTGKTVARYDKIHLFCADVADGVGRYDEGRTFEAGDKLMVASCVIDGMAVNIGMMICFDVRFALMAHRLRQLGADILTVPSAFTYTTGQAHWQMLMQARALDSQCLVIGSAQGGVHTFEHKGKTQYRETWGHSMMVDAHGQIVASSHQTQVDKNGFSIVYGEFDKDLQQKIRQAMPVMTCHRLNAVYGF